jgi:hypothetical protein
VFLWLLFEQNAENRKIKTLTGFVVMAKRKMPVAASDDDDNDDDSNSRTVSRCSCLQYFGNFFTSSRKTQAFTTALTTDQ